MIVDNFLTLDLDELSKKQWARIFKALTFFDAKGREVTCYQVRRTTVRLPRGAWGLIPDHVTTIDRRSCPSMPVLELQATLDTTSGDKSFTGQQEAVQAMLANQQGQVIRPPSTGKSLIGLAFAAAVGTRTLILVHTKDLLDQWLGYVERVLPDADVGVIQGSNYKVGHITIGMVQSVKAEIPITNDYSWWQQFGAVLYDEFHHSGAEINELIVNACTAKYRIGLTATNSRSDGMHPMMGYLFGPVIHKQKFEAKVPTEVIPIKTNFRFNWHGPFDWGRLQNALIRSEDRNLQIAYVADREVAAGESVLILSRRVEHLVKIKELMKEDVTILIGSKSEHYEAPKAAERKQILADFRAGKIKCLASTQLMDEGADVPMLSRLLLTFPGKHDGRIIQQVGRVIRQHEGKQTAQVFDFVDDKIPPLRRQWNERKLAYKKMNIKVRKVKADNAKAERDNRSVLARFKERRA